MSFKNVAEMLNIGLEGWAIAVIVLMSLVQIAPIKINPLSWLASAFGRAINRELIGKVDNLEKSIERVEVKQKQEEEARLEDKAETARVRILRFNNELLLGTPRHTKESFDQVLDDITYYENYCEHHENYKNGKAVMAIKNVRRCYDKCQIDGDFL